MYLKISGVYTPTCNVNAALLYMRKCGDKTGKADGLREEAAIAETEMVTSGTKTRIHHMHSKIFS